MSCSRMDAQQMRLNEWGTAGALRTVLTSGPSEATSEWRRSFARRGPHSGNSSQQLFCLSDGGLVRSERMARMEAALLIADGPVSARKLAQIGRLIDAAEVRELVAALNAAYDRERSAFRIEKTAGGLVLMTRATLAPWLDRLHHRASQARLSQPALETLTIIAYKQPITRADIESVRGVQSTEMIKQLIDRGLVRVGGEDDSLGRPFLYVTTRDFLGMFGLQAIADLPNYEALRRRHPDEDADTATHGVPEAGNAATAEDTDVEDDSDAGATDSAESAAAEKPAA